MKKKIAIKTTLLIGLIYFTVYNGQNCPDEWYFTAGLICGGILSFSVFMLIFWDLIENMDT